MIEQVHAFMPAHNEETGIELSLNSFLNSVRFCGSSAVTLTVIANGCTDNTAEIANRWHETTVRNTDNLKFRIIESEEGHKLTAMNIGLKEVDDSAEAILFMDADCTLDRFAVGSVLRTLSQKRPRGVSLYHTANPAFLPSDVLGTIVQMADLRRQSISRRYKLHGGFMGWNKQTRYNGGHIKFPADTPASDDTWLSYALISEYGPDVIHSVESGPRSHYIPPQTEADYVKQHSRYAVADDVVSYCFPELQPAINNVNGLLPAVEEVNLRWQALCAKNGINFSENILAYRKVRSKIEASKNVAFEELLERNGRWQPVDTARITTRATS